MRGTAHPTQSLEGPLEASLFRAPDSNFIPTPGSHRWAPQRHPHFLNHSPHLPSERGSQRTPGCSGLSSGRLLRGHWHLPQHWAPVGADGKFVTSRHDAEVKGVTKIPLYFEGHAWQCTETQLGCLHSAFSSHQPHS